jgi:hypothetical protein
VPNDNQYLVLGEVFLLERELQENSFFVDIREKTRPLKKANLANIFKRNHRILHSIYGYGEEGQEYAQNNCLIYEIPITVLLDYGGEFSETDIQILLKKIAPASKKVIVDYTYKNTTISFDSTISKQITFDLSWEGSNLLYNIYRKEKKESEYTLIHTETNPTVDFSYIDTDLQQSKTYHYAFTIIENEIELPKTNLLSIKVK